MWTLFGFLSAFAAVCGACLAGQDQRYATPYAILVFLGLGMTLIAFIATYTEGHNVGVGKPKPEEHMRPGTRYAHSYGFVEVSADGTQRRVALLHNLDEGRAEYCTLREPIPAAQLVVAVESGGKMRLQPASETHVDTTA